MIRFLVPILYILLGGAILYNYRKLKGWGWCIAVGLLLVYPFYGIIWVSEVLTLFICFELRALYLIGRGTPG